MSLSDPIADALTVIRNATRINKESVDIPSSKLLLQLLEVFKREGYIDNYRLIEDNKQGIARVYLKYDVNKKSAIIDLRKISKPGLRVYAKKDKIPRVLNGLGIAVLSTSKGVVSDREARKKKVGGEILCYVW
jgi:small subunit ribosomal protein S8